MKSKLGILLFLWLGIGSKAGAEIGGPASWDQAISQVSFEGRAQLGLDVYDRPSSREGDTAFLIRDLWALARTPIDENGEFNLKIRSAEERSAGVKKQLLLLEQANFGYFAGNDNYAVGLVEHPWLDRQTDLYDMDLWGPSSRLGSTRFKYIALVDQGFIWRREFADGAQLQLAILNGEENRSEETGPKKEAVFVWDQPQSWGFWSFGAVYGGYEQYAPTTEKSRALLRAQTRWGRSSIGLEAFMARDPADAVTDLGLAEGVQLSSDLPGQRATAVGGTLWWLYQLTEQRQFFLKLDGLNPAQEASDKGLSGAQLALITDWTESVEWTIFFEHLQKQPRHSNASSQLDRLGLSAQITF